MRISSPLLDQEIETIAELRELYRASEARAARLRLLSSSGREMAEAGQDDFEQVLENCASRLAFFVGRSGASVTLNPNAAGIPISAPGEGSRVVGRIDIAGMGSQAEIADREDAEAFQMHLELMGATIDRMNHERDRGRLLNALQEREHRLEHLVGRIFSAQEDERRRVSQELHDGVAQTATALVRMLEGTSSRPNADIPAAERAKLAAIARHLVTELRGVIGGLRPTLLDDLGLEAALAALAESLGSDGFKVDFKLSKRDIVWPANLETALFRVAQEAVANIRKHAGEGCQVHIELHLAPETGASFLSVKDNGRGCRPQIAENNADATGVHVGIDVMRERMAAVGGRLVWESKPEAGVTVIAYFPELA